MWREIAVDPALLHNWAAFERYVALFGLDRGLLISRYPKKWARLVLTAAENAREIERKRIEERLNQLRDANQLVPRGSGRWIEGDPWRKNASLEHQAVRFDGILAAWDGPAPDAGLDACELDLTNPPERLRPRTSVHIERTEAAVADAAKLLLAQAKEVFLIDQYFRPGYDTCRRVLSRILAATRGANARADFAVELHISPHEGQSVDDLEHECLKSLPGVVPARPRFTVVIWERHEKHNRYLLADRFGLQLGRGFDLPTASWPAEDSRRYDTLSLLDAVTAATVKVEHDGPSARLRQLRRVEVSGKIF